MSKLFLFTTAERKTHLTLSYLKVHGTSQFGLLFYVIKLSLNTNLNYKGWFQKLNPSSEQILNID